MVSAQCINVSLHVKGRGILMTDGNKVEILMRWNAQANSNMLSAVIVNLMMLEQPHHALFTTVFTFKHHPVSNIIFNKYNYSNTALRFILEVLVRSTELDRQ